MIRPEIENLASANKRKIAVVILLGPPGSGKGTQCKRLSNALGVPTISSGDILRANLRAGTALGLKAKEAMGRGTLVSDELICEMLLSRTLQADCEGGFVLDGMPRTVCQAEFIDLQLSRSAGGFPQPTVVSLEVEEKNLLRRLSGRRVCPNCGATYNIVTTPPLLRNRCDSDGAILETREDDREEVCRFRLESHRRTTSAIEDYYTSRYGGVRTIRGDRDPEDICAELLEIVSAHARERLL
jgi:adenylate kinase